MRETVLIGFGSNVGDRVQYCERAVALLGLLPGSALTGISSLYETAPVADVGDPGTGLFLNGVVRLETELPPRRVLETCLEIERALGRDPEDRRGPRTMDLDLLAYGSRVIDEPGLQVPHPRLSQRRFVLAPLAELQPEWEHPVLHRTARALLQASGDPAGVRRLDLTLSGRVGGRSACGARPREG